jgi:hypothetical protein
MASSRGTLQVEGFVDFPVRSPYLENSGQGGLFVKLVVVEPNEPLGHCVGVAVTDVLNGCFVADDQRALPPELDYSGDTEHTAEEMENEARAWDEYVGYHYPLHSDETLEGHVRNLSRPYRAVVVMGSTGWTGTEESGRCWYANVHSLTPEGKALYDSVQKLNPGCTLHLLTFLDT